MEFDSDALLRLRTSAALSQRELAERAGVTSDVVWRLENAYTCRPQGQTVRKLAQALGVEPVAMMRPRKAGEVQEG